jgi:oligogalacturonide lyase
MEKRCVGITTILLLIPCLWISLLAQPVLSTGGKKMPDAWIDSVTHHKIIRLSRSEGSNMSFYFHNNPFVGNQMVFYNSSRQTTAAEDENKRQEVYKLNTRNKQLYLLDLATQRATPLTHHPLSMNGEIVSSKLNEAFFQVKDSVFVVNLETKKERLVFVFPEDFKGDVTTVNADGTLLGGARGSDEEKNLFKNNPEKKDFFNVIYEAKLPRTLFTFNIKTKQLNKIFTDSAWLNHVQFSPTDSKLLMFCHEGPWHKVDRIWTINIETKEVKLMHKRTMDMEIAGHEWIGASGKTIWFDLQQPKGETFFVAGTNIKTGKEIKYSLQRNEWSVHYTSSPDEKLFAGDGGDPGAVAKAPDGQWIYLFTPYGNKLKSEKLVSMKKHNYKLEPNVHFSPDGKWIIFRANFEGVENVYAVEIKKSE